MAGTDSAMPLVITAVVGLEEAATAPTVLGETADSSVGGEGGVTALEATSIWELAGEKLEKKIDEKGKKCWKCLWCGKTFKGGHNATKAVSHLAKVKGRDIQPCHVAIPKKYLMEYNAFLVKKLSQKSEVGGKRHHTGTKRQTRGGRQ